MHLIFWALLGASLLHINEEYFFPGGFIEATQRLNPRLSKLANRAFHVTINAAFILLALAAALFGEANLVFSLSIAFLLLFNALIHLGGTLIGGRYMPGLISGVGLYVPLSLTAIGIYACAGQISVAGLGWAALLGLFFEVIPSLVLLVMAAMDKGKRLS